jgi:endonuclease YncB( thermonuclease family)
MSLENQTNDVQEFSLCGRIIDCKVVNVYDADTCKVVFELNGEFVKFTLRLSGIDAPEMRPSRSNENRNEEIIAATRARNRLIQLVTDCNIDIDTVCTKKELQKLIDLSKQIIQIECGNFDKYGRLLATLYTNDNNINTQLISEGYGYVYDGGTKKQFIL